MYVVSGEALVTARVPSCKLVIIKFAVAAAAKMYSAATIKRQPRSSLSLLYSPKLLLKQRASEIRATSDCDCRSVHHRV